MLNTPKKKRKEKKSPFNKNIQRKLAGAEIKSRTNCTNRLQEVPAFWRSLSRKQKKKNIQSFARQFSFLRISFFLFFSIFFPLALRTSLKRRNYSFSITLNIIPKFLCVSNSDLIRNHCTIFEKVFKNVKLSIKKNSISGRQISTGR